MRHFKALIGRKIMLSVLAVGVISAGALGGTYANFTATPVTIASNGFATGTLSIGRSGSGAIFNVSAQKIGQEATGTLTITNTGTIDGIFAGTAARPARSHRASSLVDLPRQRQRRRLEALRRDARAFTPLPSARSSRAARPRSTST